MSGNLYRSRNCGGIKGDLRKYIEAPWLWKVADTVLIPSRMLLTTFACGLAFGARDRICLEGAAVFTSGPHHSKRRVNCLPSKKPSLGSPALRSAPA